MRVLLLAFLLAACGPPTAGELQEAKAPTQMTGGYPVGHWVSNLVMYTNAGPPLVVRVVQGCFNFDVVGTTMMLRGAAYQLTPTGNGWAWGPNGTLAFNPGLGAPLVWKDGADDFAFMYPNQAWDCR